MKTEENKSDEKELLDRHVESEDCDVNVPDSIKRMTSDRDSDTLFQKNTQKKTKV